MQMRRSATGARERRGRERREMEPILDSWKEGGWKRAGMGGSGSLGGTLTPMHGPTCQIIIMIHWHTFQSSLKLLSPILFTLVFLASVH